MREIKFRAWDKKQHEMHYPNLIGKYGDSYTCWGDGFTETKELMQFTGLKDKNGTPIYEGDILQISCDFESRKGVGCDVVVWWDEGTGFFCNDWSLGELIKNQKEGKQDFEVVGNKFEDKDLLEDKL